jgi:hypothetical protein
MLGKQRQTLHAGQGVFQFLFQVRFVIRKFAHQRATDLANLFLIRHQLHPAKDNYTTDIERPFTGLLPAVTENL